MALMCAGVLLASFALGVNGREQTYFPLLATHPMPEVCPFKRLTGHPCAGCGLTRATISLSHGDWARAWKFNRVGLPMYLFIVALMLHNATNWWRVRRGQNAVRWRWLEGFGFVMVALLLSNWALSALVG